MRKNTGRGVTSYNYSRGNNFFFVFPINIYTAISKLRAKTRWGINTTLRDVRKAPLSGVE
jgi:hypothetical protein